jgi:hypothetical protein
MQVSPSLLSETETEEHDKQISKLANDKDCSISHPSV